VPGSTHPQPLHVKELENDTPLSHVN